MTEIGKLQHKKRDYRRAAEQLQKAVDLKPNSLQVGTGNFHPGMPLHEAQSAAGLPHHNVVHDAYNISS